MNYDINNSLENLEKNLQKVDSAREQVEETVNAYAQLQGKVGVCTNCFQTLASNVEELISSTKEHRNAISSDLNLSLVSIKEACDDINKAFDDSCGKAILNFDAKATNSVNLLNGSVDSLKEQINSLDGVEKSLTISMEKISSLKTNIEDIAKSLDSSQSSQDEILSDIDNNVKECKRVTAVTKEALSNNHSQLQTLVDSNFSEIKTLINDVESKSQKLLSDSKEQIMLQNGNNTNQITKNKKMLYCIITLVVIDIVIHFVM